MGRLGEWRARRTLACPGRRPEAGGWRLGMTELSSDADFGHRVIFFYFSGDGWLKNHWHSKNWWFNKLLDPVVPYSDLIHFRDQWSKTEILLGAMLVVWERECNTVKWHWSLRPQRWNQTRWPYEHELSNHVFLIAVLGFIFMFTYICVIKTTATYGTIYIYIIIYIYIYV